MPNNPINKVVYGGRTLIDLSNITVAPNKLAQGYTAIDKNGNLITGTLDPGGGGGGDFMLVTYTINSANDITQNTCDTSLADIQAAISDGVVIVAKAVVNPSLAQENSEYAKFVGTQYTVNNVGENNEIRWHFPVTAAYLTGSYYIAYFVIDDTVYPYPSFGIGTVPKPTAYTISTDMQGNYTVIYNQRTYSEILADAYNGQLPFFVAQLTWNGQTIAVAEGSVFGMNGPGTNSPFEVVFNFAPSGSPMPMKILLSHDNQDNVTVTAIS